MCVSISLLDYFLTANMKLSASGECHLVSISYHASIHGALNICVGKVTIFSIFYDYKRGGTRALRSRIGACDFNDIYNTADEDDQINILNGNYNLIRDMISEAPVTCEPWLNWSETKFHLSLRNLRIYVTRIMTIGGLLCTNILLEYAEEICTY